MSERRNTIQRTKILEYLNSVENHPTAEMVHKHVSKEIPTITLATVYRNLNLLAEEGEILRLEVDKEYRYDRHTSIHQHFVCDECRQVMDVFDNKISTQALKEINSKKFKAETVTIIFRGKCSNCSKK